MDTDRSTLYTVGYTSFPSPADLVETLREHGIRALVDVRSTPYSAHYEQYNKENIRRVLSEAGISYGNMALAFGARQEDPAFYKNGRLDFETFSRSDRFLRGRRRLEDGIDNGYTPVLMCAEKNPIVCHRAILVARAFSDAGYRVVHLLPDGEYKTHETLEQELLNLYFPDRAQCSIFDAGEPLDEKEYLREAYVRQNDKIGFREENLSNDRLHHRLYEEDGGTVL